QSRDFGKNFTGQMWRLIDRAQAQCHPVAIMVYGLINFESYFRGREMAERIQSEDASRYPHLETTYKYLISFRPAYRVNAVRLARMMNEQLRIMIGELNQSVGGNA